MLVMLNMTGLKRWHLVPTIQRQSNGEGLWYFNVKWLGVEITAYSRTMGCEMIRQFNEQLARRKHPPKVLETFNGVVERIDGDTAYVSLTSTTNGDEFYGEYPAAKFAAKGIEEEDRFVCRTLELVGGDTRIEIEAVPEVELTEEDLREIDERIHRVIPREDPGVVY